ncbi:MAG: DUF2335 domain-containing protein [Acidobacteriaceae bacterium]
MSGHRINDSPPSPQTQPGPPEPGEIAQIQAAFFSGPLPHPDLLAKYNDVIPNGAERIMAMAERQSAHRESLEALVVKGNLASQTRGSYFAFILALVCIAGGFSLVYTGRSGEGISAIIISIASLVSVFIYSKHEQKKERVEKALALQSRKPR